MIRLARAGFTVALIAGLPGCGRSAPVPAPEAAPPPRAAANGAVNPDAHVTTYACADGSTVTAGYPDSQSAVVDYEGHAYNLRLARSANGARYTGMGLQWWTRPTNKASLAILKPGEETASAPGLECAGASP